VSLSRLSHDSAANKVSIAVHILLDLLTNNRELRDDGKRTLRYVSLEKSLNL
jgi:hypothetical protein